MRTKSKKFLIGSEIIQETVGDGIKRQILGFDGQLMLVKVIVEKGAIGYQHEHFHSQCSYIVSGKFEVTIDRKMKIMQAGDSFYTEPNIRHGIVCIESGELIDAFSPSRQDFLK